MPRSAGASTRDRPGTGRPSKTLAMYAPTRGVRTVSSARKATIWARPFALTAGGPERPALRAREGARSGA